MAMTSRRRIGGAFIAAVLATTGARPLAQNSSQFRDWNASVLADGAQAKPRAACATLVAMTGYEFSVITAAPVAATNDAPEYCRVTGQIQPEIRFEVSLPAAWNGRLYVFGNGGYAGEALDAPGRVASARRALARGFAVAQMNTGHDAAVEPLGTFAANSQKFLDYAYRGMHVTVLTAKKILQSYYDGSLRHSYFDGCSTGGRQALISAQRFPEDFDGVVAGAPVLNFSGTMIDYASNQRALAAAPIAPEKLKIIADAVYKKCDAIDGASDGLIDDPRQCPFRPSADLPRCTGDADGPSCFTAAQVKTLETIYGGVQRNGAELFPGWPVGAEIGAPGPGAPGGGASGWMPWFVGAPNLRPIQINFGETFFKYMAFGKPNPSYDWLTFSVDADLDKIQWARNILDATDPDLSRFKARGGKIVGYFGWADPALNPMMGVNYYESVLRTVGPSTTDFYRLFMVPGMFHCGGGIGTSTFDALTPLIEWVEKGTAPKSIAASRLVDGKAVRTRPLCPYPEVAKYKGSGSIDEAANFSCGAPARVPSSRP
jgi:tannase/feruloyl esterase